MDALLSVDMPWLIILFIMGWAVIMCLKAISRDVEYNEAVHSLKLEAAELRIEHHRRFRQRVEAARQRRCETAKRRIERKAADAAEEQAASDTEPAQPITADPQAGPMARPASGARAAA